MLDLIAGLLQPFADLLPRVSHRPSSIEWCVVDSWLQGPYSTRKPVVYLPAITPIEYYPNVPFPIDLEVQTLRTADDIEITVNASVMVYIDSPLLMREAIGYDEYVSNIGMECRSVIQEFISGHNFRHGLESFGSLELAVGDALLELTNNGVYLQRLCIEDAARTQAFRLYGLSLSEPS